MLEVDRCTVVRWADAGDCPASGHPGGHRRFRQSDVALLLAAGVAGKGSDRPPRRNQLRVLRSVPAAARDTRRLERAARLLTALEGVGQALGVAPEAWGEVANLPRTCWDVTRPAQPPLHEGAGRPANRATLPQETVVSALAQSPRGTRPAAGPAAVRGPGAAA
jgi:hypothetical protein